MILGSASKKKAPQNESFTYFSPTIPLSYTFLFLEPEKNMNPKKKIIWRKNLLSIFEFYLVLKLWKDTIFKTLCFVIMKHFRMSIEKTEKKNTYEISSISFKVLQSKRAQFSLLSFKKVMMWKSSNTPFLKLEKN